MTVRVRGIYATALTHLLHEGRGVVQASPAIDARFEEATFTADPASVAIETSEGRLGVGLTGDPAAVGETAVRIRDVGRDAIGWVDPLPRGAVFAGEVTDTLGGGAVVAIGEGAEGTEDDADLPVANRPLEGYLPFGATDDRIDEGNRLLVQVDEPRAPWSGDRPVLDTTLRVQGGLVSLVRGASGRGGQPSLADVLPDDPREGWAARWHDASEDADLDALGDALADANERAATVDEALADAPDASEGAPGLIATDEATAWIRFGRETRFALDEHRRSVTPTMAGHHRIKAGADAASAAVDFAEAVLADADGGAADGRGADQGDEGEGAFPFHVTTRHFGPREGDRVAIGHGKPDGRLVTLGNATVTEVDPEGSVTLEREMTPGGTYDGLGIERRAGDVATTTITEGRWWYPTVYRDSDGERRGTYVNVCTPVEVFPESVCYVDLHVDVVKHADGTVERLDDDELDAAEATGFIPAELAEKARDVASAIERAL